MSGKIIEIHEEKIKDHLGEFSKNTVEEIGHTRFIKKKHVLFCITCIVMIPVVRRNQGMVISNQSSSPASRVRSTGVPIVREYPPV